MYNMQIIIISVAVLFYEKFRVYNLNQCPILIIKSLFGYVIIKKMINFLLVFLIIFYFCRTKPTIMIKEELLHFLWRTHRIPKIGLRTTSGDAVEILSAGVLNHSDGPDFLNAKVRIGDVLWVGPVELHLKSSDWFAHKHQHDSRYESVILHVVLEENQQVQVLNRRLPCLEIRQFLTKEIVNKYRDLKACKENLACSPYEIPDLENSFFWMRDRLITERLQNRIQYIQSRSFGQQITFYTLLFGALGAKSNRQPFMEFAQKINWPQLRRWIHRPERIYAYLMYLSGLFDQEVQKLTEYNLIAAYEKSPMLKTFWQTRQIRPSGQPKKRVLEICALLVQEVFTPLLETEDAHDYAEQWSQVLAEMQSGSYEHIRFSEFVLRNIALNAIIPYAYFRGVQSGDTSWFDFALSHFEEWPAEQNKIVKLYERKGLKVKSGGDSQALLELYHNYCVSKKCVSCAIGFTLLRA